MALVCQSHLRDHAITMRDTAEHEMPLDAAEELEMNATLQQAHTVQLSGLSPVVASLERVDKNYGPIRALNGVDFQVRAGEVVALLGPNGAGKTTAVKLLLGLLQPNSGKARVFGGDPTNPENRMRTGAMLQVGRVHRSLLHLLRETDGAGRCPLTRWTRETEG